ncbi:MAG: peptidoglycan DD-metalloendopeptidase family protein [Candidatus Eisenbacteria bacterium]
MSKRTATVAVVLFAVFIGFSAFWGFRSFTDAVNRARLAELEQENEILRSEVAKLSGKVEGLEGAMAEHVEFEEQVRILADLDPMDKDTWEVGVGGPQLPTDAALLEPGGGSLTSLNQDVDRLLRQIKLQRHSYSEILERLKERSDDLDHLPSIRPVDVGYISSYFGRRTDPFTGRKSRHEGVDFSARQGSNVYATADGVVSHSKYERGYGYTIKIDHGNGIITKYAHNAKLLVKKGKTVKRGDVIAYLGNTGRSTAPHLHYEVSVNGVAQNPLNFILPSDIVVD